MGKKRTRLIGDEEIEKKQKAQSKERAMRKKEGEETVEAPVTEKAPTEKTSTEEIPASKKKGKKGVGTKKKEAGKKYQHALKQVDKSKSYPLASAVELLKKMSYTSFNESVEVHINILETNQRGEVSLPHSTGRTITVKILDDALLDSIASGIIDFDVLIAHPSFMSKLGKYAKVLGPKGLMPNPKAGTINTEPEKAAEKFKKGVLHWKSESKFPIIHQTVAKFSLDTKAIVENIESFIESVGKKNIKELYIAGSMTPSVKITLE
ncbi:MAG: hypothetical protein O3B87_00845 [bacterium]|nr:hypothetical protein [bacterium]